MTNLTTSRRALLGALPATAVAVAIPATAAPIADRTAWNAAMSNLAKIEAEDAAFTPGWMDTWRRCKAECEAIPHTILEPDPYSGRKAPVSTGDRNFVAYARRTVEELDAGTTRFDNLPGLRAHEKLCRDTVAAADERDRQVQAVNDRYDIDRLDEKAERLGDALADAQRRLLDMPAPDLAALRWKLDRVLALEHADDEDGGNIPAWSHSYVRQTLADIARLLPAGA